MKPMITSILLLAFVLIPINIQADFNSTMKLSTSGDYNQAYQEPSESL